MNKFHKLFLPALSIAFVLTLIFSISPVLRAQDKGEGDGSGGDPGGLIGGDGLGGIEAPGSTQYMNGYGWSTNIGWISFKGVASNGEPYGVQIDGSGNLSGNAWSSNVGWLDVSGLGITPSGSGTSAGDAHFSGTTFTGWMRFDRAIVRTDGWDGWVSMKGTGYGITATPDSKDPTLIHLSGYLWGSGVVGWIDMSRVTITTTLPPPEPPDPPGTPSGGVTGCSPYVTWGAVPNADDYQVSRRNPDGTSKAFGLVTGTFFRDPDILTPGQTYYYKVRAHNNDGYSAYSPEYGILIPLNCNSSLLPIIGSFKAIPASVPQNGQCALTWAGIQHITRPPDAGCVITGPSGVGGSYPWTLPDNPFPSTGPADGSRNSKNITASSRYTLTCTNSSGVAVATTTCNLKPSFIEF